MKGKDYNLEGIKSRSSKQTHCTNMTGKIGMTSTQSITTKKFAMDSVSKRETLMQSEKRLQP
jgi:hypothetical protein